MVSPGGLREQLQQGGQVEDSRGGEGQVPQDCQVGESCYGTPSFLNFGEEVVLSEGGVQQGNPLGPPLFALLLHPVAKKLQEVDGLVLNTWYMDNGTLIGS